MHNPINTVFFLQVRMQDLLWETFYNIFHWKILLSSFPFMSGTIKKIYFSDGRSQTFGKVILSCILVRSSHRICWNSSLSSRLVNVRNSAAVTSSSELLPLGRPRNLLPILWCLVHWVHCWKWFYSLKLYTIQFYHTDNKIFKMYFSWMAASDSNPKLPPWSIWNWPATSLQQLAKSLNQRWFLQAFVADFVFPGCESYITHGGWSHHLCSEAG